MFFHFHLVLGDYRGDAGDDDTKCRINSASILGTFHIRHYLSHTLVVIIVPKPKKSKRDDDCGTVVTGIHHASSQEELPWASNGWYYRNQYEHSSGWYDYRQ